MKKLLFPVFLLFIIVGLSSCEKEDNTKTQQEVIEEKSASLVQEAAAYNEEPGIQAMEQLSDMNLPFMAYKKRFSVSNPFFPIYSIKDLASGKKKGIKKSDLDNVYLDGNAGTYTWVSATSSWDYDENNPADKIIVHFPTEGSSSNNATFTLGGFEYEAVYDEFWEVYYETALAFEASMTIDGEVVYTYSFSSEIDAYSSVVNAEVRITAGDYEIINAATSDDSEVSVVASFSKAGEVLFSMSQEQIGDWFIEGSQVKTTLQFGGYKVVGVIDLYDYFSIAFSESITEDQINAVLDYRIFTYPENEEIGVVNFEMRNPNEFHGVITFNDGSTQDFEDFFSGIQDAIDAIFGEDTVSLDM